MLEEIKELLEKRHEAYESCMEKYEKVCEEFNNKLVELLPYENTIVRIDNAYALGISIYIKVRELFRHGDKIIIRGYGFKSEFTSYEDATFADWDFMQSFEFRLDNITSEVEKIHIINEVEFDKAFNGMINNMRFRHMKEMI